jgi:hypothetical protein
MIDMRRLTVGERAAAGGVAVAISCAFVLAAWLSPDPRGVGTHEQLGMPPCTMHWVLGIPCPFCGMTTAFSLLAHGRPLAAFRTQPAGLIIALASAGAILGCIAAAAIGRGPDALEERLLHSRRFVIAVLTLLGVAWVYKIIMSVVFAA